MNPKMQIVWNVLEAAKLNGDQMVVSMCRQCIIANRLGWKRHNGDGAFKMVRAFYEANMCERRWPDVRADAR